MKPQDLANKYMKDKIWKVHQSKIDAHSSDGDDSWRIPIHLGAMAKKPKLAELGIPLNGEARNLLSAPNSITRPSN